MNDAIPERAIRNPRPRDKTFLSEGWIPVNLSNLFPGRFHCSNFLSIETYWEPENV